MCINYNRLDKSMVTQTKMEWLNEQFKILTYNTDQWIVIFFFFF